MSHKYEDLLNNFNNYFDFKFKNPSIKYDNFLILKGKKFYKYCSFDKQGYTFKNIINSSLHATSVRKFNDIFDSNPTFNFASWDLYLSKTKRVQIAKDSTTKMRRYDEIYNVINNLRSEVFAVCLTDMWDNQLMWAHYCDKYSGICIEYEIKESFNDLDTTIVPMIYTSERPKITPSIMNLNMKTTEGIMNFNKKMFSYYIKKPAFWNYENEYRIFVDKSLVPDLDVKSFIITAIYYGPNIEKENLEKLKVICAEKKILLYSIYIDSNEYILKRKSVL